MRSRSRGGWNLIALLVILGYIAIAVVNTLVMATGERSREFALMQLIGSSRGQVRSMMRIEAVLVAVTGMVFGVVVAIPPLIGVSMGISGSADSRAARARVAGDHRRDGSPGARGAVGGNHCGHAHPSDRRDRVPTVGAHGRTQTAGSMPFGTLPAAVAIRG